jgi:hypothetical protein
MGRGMRRAQKNFDNAFEPKEVLTVKRDNVFRPKGMVYLP